MTHWPWRHSYDHFFILVVARRSRCFGSISPPTNIHFSRSSAPFDTWSAYVTHVNLRGPFNAARSFTFDWSLILTLHPFSLFPPPVGRWDGHGEAGGVCSLGGGRRSVVGHVQTGPSGLRHQEAPDRLCGRGRQGGNRHSRGRNHQVWRLCKYLAVIQVFSRRSITDQSVEEKNSRYSFHLTLKHYNSSFFLLFLVYIEIPNQVEYSER